MRHDIAIREGGLADPQVLALLREHLASMAALSPPESTHALPLAALRAADVTFWGAWRNGALLGCGALKQLDATHGEIKSMRTVAAVRRTGVARALLEHIIDTARGRGYRRLSLETGAMAPFAPARTLYARTGFVACAPFGDYRDDPNSVFMTLVLSPAVRHASPAAYEPDEKARA